MEFSKLVEQAYYLDVPRAEFGQSYVSFMDPLHLTLDTEDRLPVTLACTTLPTRCEMPTLSVVLIKTKVIAQQHVIKQIDRGYMHEKGNLLAINRLCEEILRHICHLVHHIGKK